MHSLFNSHFITRKRKEQLSKAMIKVLTIPITIKQFYESNQKLNHLRDIMLLTWDYNEFCVL